MEHSLFLQLTDCAADVLVISLFYNTLTPTEYLKVRKVHLDFQNVIHFENISPSFYDRFPVGELLK